MPFACAVGEYEEDNPSCDFPVLSLAGLGVVAVGAVAGRVTRRPAVQWGAVVIAFVLASLGWDRGL